MKLDAEQFQRDEATLVAALWSGEETSRINALRELSKHVLPGFEEEWVNDMLDMVAFYDDEGYSREKIVARLLDELRLNEFEDREQSAVVRIPFPFPRVAVGGEIASTPTSPLTPMVGNRLADIWIEYNKTKTEALRNVLMENYLHLVRYTAERIHVRLPDEVELDDLISAGIFGLMDAIEAFDPRRGVKFETYCAPRIRGAVLDELRSLDWVPRLVRSRAHRLDSATRQLEVELGRSPTPDEVARRLKVSMAEFENMAKDASAVGLVSLSRKWFETDGNKDVREIDILEDKRGADPVRKIQRKDLKELITKGLSRAERLIIILYYFEEMTMKEIGLTLDLSEPRVIEMHNRIMARLREQMASKEKEHPTSAHLHTDKERS